MAASHMGAAEVGSVREWLSVVAAAAALAPAWGKRRSGSRLLLQAEDEQPTLAACTAVAPGGGCVTGQPCNPLCLAAGRGGGGLKG